MMNVTTTKLKKKQKKYKTHTQEHKDEVNSKHRKYEPEHKDEKRIM